MSHLSEERAFWVGVLLTQLFGLNYSTVWVLFRFDTTRQMRQKIFPVYFHKITFSNICFPPVSLDN